MTYSLVRANIWSHKDRLPKGRSYPLKTSQLVDVVAPFLGDTPVYISFHLSKRPTRSVVTVSYSKPSALFPHAGWSLRVNAISPVHRKIVDESFMTLGVPALSNWFVRVLPLIADPLAVVSRMFFRAEWDGETLLFVAEPES